MRHNWIFKAVPAFIAFCFVAVIAGWIGIAYIGTKEVIAASDKGVDGIAYEAGKAASAFKRGMEDK